MYKITEKLICWVGKTCNYQLTNNTSLWYFQWRFLAVYHIYRRMALVILLCRLFQFFIIRFWKSRFIVFRVGKTCTTTLLFSMQVLTHVMVWFLFQAENAIELGACWYEVIQIFLGRFCIHIPRKSIDVFVCIRVFSGIIDSRQWYIIHKIWTCLRTF